MELVKCKRLECEVMLPHKKCGAWIKIYCSGRCRSTDHSRQTRGTQSKETLDFYKIAICKRQQTDHARYLKLVNGAKIRSIEVFLTEEQYSEIVKDGVCFYCGLDLFNGRTFRTCVDRYDRKIGYTFENCRACCWRCNEIKGSLERWFSIERAVSLLKEAIEGIKCI